MNTREIQACIRSVVNERARTSSGNLVQAPSVLPMATATAETAADLILDAEFMKAVKQEFETAGVDAGYDPSK